MKKPLCIALALVFTLGCVTVRSSFKEGDTEWGHNITAVFSKIDAAALKTSYTLVSKDVDGELAQEITQGQESTGMSSEQALERLVQGMAVFGEFIVPYVSDFIGALRGPKTDATRPE